MQNLSYDIVLHIADNLYRHRDVSALARANHTLFDLLITYLYKRNMRSKVPALFWCCRNGLLTPIRRFLSLKADVNAFRELHRGKATPLMTAAIEGWVETTRLLLKHGARINICNTDAQMCNPPLTLAAAGWHRDFALSSEDDIFVMIDSNSFEGLPIPDVSRTTEDIRDHYAVVKLLLEHGAKTNHTFFSRGIWTSPIVSAIRGANFDIVKLLLEHGISIPLLYPAGGSPRVIGNRWIDSLREACDLRPPDRALMLDLMLEHGANINYPDGEGETLIFSFTQFYHSRSHVDASIRIVRELCQRGARVNHQNYRGDTPLNACSSNMVDVLLENGADVNIPARDGWTCLFLHPEASVIKRLLAYGADANIEDREGATPLSMALARREDSAVEVMELLLRHGADVHKPPHFETSGKSNLHVAAEMGNVNMIKLFLEYGADPSARAMNGQTAIDLAKDKEAKEVLARWARESN